MRYEEFSMDPRYVQGVVIVCALLLSRIATGQCYQTAYYAFQPRSLVGESGLVDALNPEAKGTLTIIAFGDSVVWGNGDVAEHKWVQLVGKRIADDTGRPVEVFSYAHSGAALVNPVGAVVPTLNGVPQGDLNSAEPNVPEQATCVAGSHKSAELVLLDGCINDVNADDIAIPWPFNWTTTDTIQKRVFANCGAPVGAAMEQIEQLYPMATVVQLAYYPIVSDQSHFPEAAGVPSSHEYSSEHELNRLSKEQIKLRRLRGDNREAVKTEIAGLPSWPERSAVFYTQTKLCFEWAIAKVNGLNPPDPPSVDPNSLQSCPGKDLSAAAKATKVAHTYLALLPEGHPEYAYGTTETHLWKLPFTFLWWTFNKDEMYDARAQICKQVYTSVLDREVCRINPIAHPNVKGAEAYADAVMTQISAAWAH
jgi:hypothetical protein